MKYLWLCLALAVKRGQVSGKCETDKKFKSEMVDPVLAFPIHELLQAASCSINPPLETSTGSDLGFIMIPGAQVLLAFLLEHLD